MRCDKAPLGDGALPELMTGAVSTTDTIAAWDYTTILPQSGCPRCASLAPHCASPRTPPHHQRQRHDLSHREAARWQS